VPPLAPNVNRAACDPKRVAAADAGPVMTGSACRELGRYAQGCLRFGQSRGSVANVHRRLRRGAEPNSGSRRPTGMIPRTLVLALALASLAGCGTAGAGASPSTIGAASSRGVPSNSAKSPSAGSQGPAIPSTVPPEVMPACGNPGASIVLTHVPLTVKHHDCDLSGVTIRIGDNGTGAVVPAPGGRVSGNADVGAGGVPPADINISVDAKTGDVTITE
jgi:hypothetical protein